MRVRRATLGMEEFGCFFGGHRHHEPMLAIFIQVTENVGTFAGRQYTEKRIAIVGLEILDDLRRAGRVVVLGEEVAQDSRFATSRISSRVDRAPGADVVWTLS